MQITWATNLEGEVDDDLDQTSDHDDQRNKGRQVGIHANKWYFLLQGFSRAKSSDKIHGHTEAAAKIPNA